MKGRSKWVETAMRPVPERSHILKTWPTKAGPPPPLPPPLPLELSLETLTDLAEGWVDSAVERGGAKKRGREIEEGGWGENGGEGGLCELKREMKFEAVDWRKEEIWLLLLRRRWGSDGRAMQLQLAHGRREEIWVWCKEFFVWWMVMMISHTITNYTFKLNNYFWSFRFKKLFKMIEK